MCPYYVIKLYRQTYEKFTKFISIAEMLSRALFFFLSFMVIFCVYFLLLLEPSVIFSPFSDKIYELIIIFNLYFVDSSLLMRKVFLVWGKQNFQVIYDWRRLGHTLFPIREARENWRVRIYSN